MTTIITALILGAAACIAVYFLGALILMYRFMTIAERSVSPSLGVAMRGRSGLRR